MKLADALQVVGLLILAASFAIWSLVAGGITLGVGCLLFGVAMERR
jgi:hypothetical protein